MHVELCLDQSDSKIFETVVIQEKYELLSYFLRTNVHPEQLQINVAFSRLCQGMLNVL